MKYSRRLLFIFILPLFAFTVHKYYLSLAEINYSEKEKSLQIIMNVFMDDIELSVNKKYNVDLQLTSKKELKNADTYFEKYLNENFKISVNNKEAKYKYLGKEYDGDIVYFYLEIPDVNSVKSIEIKNSVLIKDFAKQQNLIKVNIGDNKQSKLLTKNNNKAMLKF